MTKVLGVAFLSGKMSAVVVQWAEGVPKLQRRQEVSLSGTRNDPAARAGASLRACQTVIGTLLTETAPDIVAVKKHAEKGLGRVGASAIKLETLLLLMSTADIRWVTPQQVKKTLSSLATDMPRELEAKYADAYAAAFSACQTR